MRGRKSIINESDYDLWSPEALDYMRHHAEHIAGDIYFTNDESRRKYCIVGALNTAEVAAHRLGIDVGAYPGFVTAVVDYQRCHPEVVDDDVARVHSLSVVRRMVNAWDSSLFSEKEQIVAEMTTPRFAEMTTP